MTKNRNDEGVRPMVLVVGGGPAGLSAARWCRELGLGVLLVEAAEEPGGQLLWIHNPIENYLGLRTGNGREMRDRFLENFPADVPRRFGAGVESVDAESFSAKLAGGESLVFDSLIFATGVRRRKLGIEGEGEFRGRGVMESGAGERETVAGGRVLIIGGGDAALENALILSEHASAVTVAHRRGEFSARAEFQDEAGRRPNVELLLETTAEKIKGSDGVEAVELFDGRAGRKATRPFDHVLVRIGVEPNSGPVRGVLKTDDRGYILIDGQCGTSVAGIYAAGDVCSPVSPTISTAAGHGATAAKAAFAWLNRSKRANL